MRLPSGTRVRRYEIDSLLGAGGMGEVYLARDVELGRTVALKVLPPAEGDDDDRIRRFLQEAKAAIALNHPHIAHIYDAGDENGVRFMAMEYVEGQTLRERMNGAPLSIDEAVDIAIQVASALASAHAQGIVHRDIKPENVMLRPDGYVKVLDFGLAKLTGITDTESTQPLRTDTGIVMGTVHYMSPEQLRAETVDSRTDVFSLGVLLYELVTGRRPFVASSPSGVIAAILTDDPPPLEGAPEALNTVLAKSMAKKRADRYATASEMLTALKSARGTGRIQSGDVLTQVLSSTSTVRRRRMPRYAIVAIAIVPMMALLSMFFARKIEQQRRVERAREAVPRLEKLADDLDYFGAWDLAKSIEPAIDDSRLGRALEKVSTQMSVATEPTGAQVFLQRVLPDGNMAEGRELIGETPIEKRPMAKGDYIVTIEKSGYAPSIRSLQAQPVRHAQGLLVPTQPPVLKVKLMKSDAVPPGMAPIEGGPYRLTGWLRASDKQVALGPYFIDRYEVSNRDFERFIRDGGYRRRELWKHPFVQDGKTLSFDEAMALLRDTTGLAGPRSWANGSFPQGRENYPVTDITWYEAAAFAEWAGKRLPSIFEWDKAARNGLNSGVGRTYPWGTVTEADVTLRANFRQAGPMPVDSLPSGMSMWGVSHLAGNVTEWILNRNEDGYAATGAAYDDAMYSFGMVGTYPGFFSAPKLGFRCAKGPAEQGTFALATNRTELPVYKPVSDAEFEKIRERYAYRKVSDAKVIERKETVDWIREKVTYTGGNGSVATLYLYLPKGLAPPYQVVHFIPAGDVARGVRPLPASIEGALTSLIRSGRAVFGVVMEGYLERERKGPSPLPNSPEAVDEFVNDVIDLRRGLDYISARPDLDAKRIGFYGPSAGADVGLVVTGLDDRYAAVAFSGAGVRAREIRSYQTRAELGRLNFVPRIAAPKLMLHGRYDESHPLKTEAEPIYNLMRAPKDLVVFEGGHIPSREVLIRTLTTFFDKHLGPVGR